MSISEQRPRSQRQLKVGEMLKQALSSLFLRGDIYGPKGETISVTISEVRVSPDLHNATVFYMPLGGKDKDVIAGLLKGITPMLRASVSKAVYLRHMPELYFKLDETFENASRINALLAEKDRE